MHACVNYGPSSRLLTQCDGEEGIVWDEWSSKLGGDSGSRDAKASLWDDDANS